MHDPLPSQLLWRYDGGMTRDDATATARRELSDIELAAWRGFLRAHGALVKALDDTLEASHDLSLSSYDVLVQLRGAPGNRLRMAELADAVLLSRSGMTRLVDRLERDGLLRRDTCSSDARGCFAVLTDAGHELLVKARPTHLAGVRERFLAHFDEAEMQVLAVAWGRVLGEQDLSHDD
jgi:DNA-binding MarR family transcriptional regulator